MQKKAAKVKFDFASANDALDKIQEELNELRTACQQNNGGNMEEELGDLIFSAVNFARLQKMRSAEELLADANKKFALRFRFVESELARRGIPWENADVQLMDSLWQQAKQKS